MVKEEHDEIELAGLRFQIGVFEQVLEKSPTDVDALRFLAHAYGAVGRPEDRLRADQRLCALAPREPRAFYNLACSHALLDHLDDAIEALSKAFRLGFRDGVLLRKDHELDPLREDPRFIELARTLEE